MGNESDIMMAMAELLPTLQKYSEVQPKFIDIKTEKFSDGVVIKIRSDKHEVTEALSDLLKAMSKMSDSSCKVTYTEVK